MSDSMKIGVMVALTIAMAIVILGSAVLVSGMEQMQSVSQLAQMVKGYEESSGMAYLFQPVWPR